MGLELVLCVYLLGDTLRKGDIHTIPLNLGWTEITGPWKALTTPRPWFTFFVQRGIYRVSIGRFHDTGRKFKVFDFSIIDRFWLSLRPSFRCATKKKDFIKFDVKTGNAEKPETVNLFQGFQKQSFLKVFAIFVFTFGCASNTIRILSRFEKCQKKHPRGLKGVVRVRCQSIEADYLCPHVIACLIQTRFNLFAHFRRGRPFRLWSADIVVWEFCPRGRNGYT